MTAARVKLILGRDADSAFFATLALRLKLAVNWDVPTLATDGRLLAYNPEFVVGLTKASWWDAWPTKSCTTPWPIRAAAEAGTRPSGISLAIWR